MKKLFLLALLLAFTSIGLGQGSGPITVKEVDGSPVCNNCRTFVFPNGSLTVSGNKVTVASGGGSSGITIGTTTVTSGTGGRLFYETAGNVVGQISTLTSDGSLLAFASGVTTGTGATSGLNATANSLTTGDAFNFASSSVSSGNVFKIAATGTAAASNTKTALNVATSGANSTSAMTTYGAQISNASTGTTSINIGLLASASGGASENRAIYVSAGQVSIQSGTASIPSIGLVPGLPNYGIYYAGGINFTIGSSPVVNVNATTVLASASRLGWTSAATADNATADLILRRSAAANLAFGAADAGAPVAQTQSVQNVVAGTSNTAGANWTHNASIGTGTGVGGDYIVQTAPAGSTGTAQNSLAAAFTVKGNGAVQLKSVTFTNLPTVANGYLIYCSDCTLASPCASGGTGALAKGINSAWVCN